MPDKQVDVCVIGAGAAGISCAHGLARRGYSVALLERLHPLPDCLKAEKIEPEAILALIRFGFQAAVDEVATPLHNVAVYFGERALGTLQLDPPEAGLYYPDLINSLRKHIDPRVDFLPSLKATAIEQQPNGVQVITDKDTRITCKLAILATGDARHLLEQLGAVYENQPPNHVFAAAFTFEGTLGSPDSPLDSVTYHHPVPDGPIAYATFFKLGASLRANIFCPGPTSDDWQRDLKHKPLEAMSGYSHVLAKASRSWRATSPVITRKMQVSRATPPTAPRVVVLGDAAHIIDPSGSGGLTFALMEAELLLSSYLPDWLSNSECDPAAFYNDPRRKGALDEFFARGRYIYALNHDPSLPGKSRRLKFALDHLIASRFHGRPASVQPNGAPAWRLPAPFLYEQFAEDARPSRK
ncbi:MAG: NAD(P)/FAD-dependent oxidoreductase, partial [Chloroflexia bacterium]